MSTAILSIISGIGGMFGWGIYDFLGGVYARVKFGIILFLLLLPLLPKRALDITHAGAKTLRFRPAVGPKTTSLIVEETAPYLA